jgi:hypothetical protein
MYVYVYSVSAYRIYVKARAWVPISIVSAVTCSILKVEASHDSTHMRAKDNITEFHSLI